MFKKRFKKEIKDKIIHHKYYMILENQIDTLCELINVVIKLDNQLYECRLEKNPKRENYASQRKFQFNR